MQRIFYVYSKDKEQKKNYKKIVTIRDADTDSAIDKAKLNQKHVYLYLFNEQSKPDAKEMILDQYKNKIIMFGYILV